MNLSLSVEFSCNIKTAKGLHMQVDTGTSHFSHFGTKFTDNISTLTFATLETSALVLNNDIASPVLHSIYKPHTTHNNYSSIALAKG